LVDNGEKFLLTVNVVAVGELTIGVLLSFLVWLILVLVIVNFRCIYFRLKMAVRPKHVAAKLNKIVKSYLNRVV
jgi:hypothetical protein